MFSVVCDSLLDALCYDCNCCCRKSSTDSLSPTTAATGQRILTHAGLCHSLFSETLSISVSLSRLFVRRFLSGGTKAFRHARSQRQPIFTSPHNVDALGVHSDDRTLDGIDIVCCLRCDTTLDSVPFHPVTKHPVCKKK